MAIHFPKFDDIRLGKAPLAEVICQVKFPPILRISEDIPMTFQDIIRNRFTKYSLETGLVFRMPDEKDNKAGFVEVAPKVHRFKTKDDQSNVGLTADFFAISNSAYSHWHEFYNDVDLVRKATFDAYQPSYATRIGLRYVNRFTYANSGVQNTDTLLGMFRDELTCLIRTDAWESPTDLGAQIVLVDGEQKLSLRIGYGSENETYFFVLDIDVFEEGEIPFDHLMDRLNDFHLLAYDAFRWSIKKNDLKRFQPQNSRGI